MQERSHNKNKLMSIALNAMCFLVPLMSCLVAPRDFGLFIAFLMTSFCFVFIPIIILLLVLLRQAKSRIMKQTVLLSLLGLGSGCFIVAARYYEELEFIWHAYVRS